MLCVRRLDGNIVTQTGCGEEQAHEQGEWLLLSVTSLSHMTAVKLIWENIVAVSFQNNFYSDIVNKDNDVITAVMQYIYITINGQLWRTN